MYQTRELHVFGFDVQLPAPNDSFLYLLLDSAIFLLAAMYLDNVLPGAHGSPKHPLFFLSPSYWGCKRRGGPVRARVVEARHAGDAGRVVW